MPVPLRLALLLAAAAAMRPAFAADMPPKPTAPEAGEPARDRFERRVLIQRHAEAARERETVAFLGVETAPVPPALTSQLSLAKNIGLVVREIVTDSPAAALLQRHDILLKLDDQWLVDARQFSVLVRNHQPGDEVTLTYVRGGKQDTVKVKLSKHEVPKFSLAIPHEFGVRTGAPFKASVRHVLPLLEDGHERGARPATAHPGPGFSATAVAPDNSNMVFTDDNGTLELSTKEGKKTLVAKDAKGGVLYSGPVDTPEQRAKLPAVVGRRLEEIEAMRRFSFEPGPGFTENLVFGDPDEADLSVLALPEEERENEAL